MKQRILSLFLVVCMLAVAVPVFLLPAAATGETIYEFRSADGDGRTDQNTYGTLLTTVTGSAALAALDLDAIPGAPEDLLGWYTWHNAEFVSAAAFAAGIVEADGTVIFYPVTKTSTFTSSKNMPLSDKAAGTFGAFRGGWLVGRYSSTAFTRYESNNAGILTITTDNWGDGGIYAGASGNPTGTVILCSYAGAAASTVRYQAVAAGSATLTVPKVATSQTGSAAIMAIMHNGVYLWPEALKGQSFTTIAADKASFADTPDEDLTLNLTLAIGDTVDVLVKRKDGAAIGTAYVNPIITYTGDVKTVDFHSIFAQAPGGANFPVIADGVATQTGPWRVGRYKSGTFAAFVDASASSLMKVTGEAEWSNGAMYFNAASGGANVPYMAILPSGDNYTSAVQYTAQSSAVVDITVDVSFVHAGHAYAILHNNEIIWPVSGKTFTSDYVADDWQLTTEAKAAVPTVTLSGITVAAGDTIAFVADRGTTANSGQGFYGLDMRISGRLLAAGSSAESNLPDTAGENGSTATYPGAWSLVNYDKADDITADNARLMNIYLGKEFWVDSTGQPTYNVGAYRAAAYRSTASYWGSKPGAIAVAGGAAAGWRYTAEVSGFAQLDFAEFGNYIKDNDGNAIDSASVPTTEYAIYLNGQKIWPADGWYSIADMEANQNYADTVNAAVAAACPNGIYLTTGDHLEVLCKTPSGTSIYGGRGQRFAPRVIVEKKVADPTLEYSARLNDAFSLNFGLTAADARSVRLVYTLDGGDAQTVTCTKDGALFSAATEGVAAAHMTAPLTYTLWGEVEADDGAVFHRLAAGETTFAAVMMKYVEAYRDATDEKGKAIYNLAVATLNYGAAAQERFNAENTTLPNAGLTEEEKAYTLTGEAADATLSTDENAIYTFAGASLLLEDTVKLKVFVNAQDGKTAPTGKVYLEYATNADFTDAEKVEMAQQAYDTPTNDHLKAALTILPDAYAKTYYMRVVDGNGNVIGTVLTYSVAAYAERVPGEKTLTDRIMTMGKAAEAYLAAMQA